MYMKTQMSYALKMIAILFATLLFCFACDGADAGVAQENTLLKAAAVATSQDDLVGLSALESKALKLSNVDAVRQGGQLTLHLSSGDTKRYVDNPACQTPGLESKCQKYRLIVHAQSRGVFIIAKLYYESVEYLLVDDGSGDETVVRGFPHFSPSGKHVVVLLMNDEQLGFAVQVWRREGHKFILDWSGSPYAEGMYTSYNLVGWPSEDTIEIESETENEPPQPRVKRHFVLHHAVNGWKVIETSK
jgi:hypothetical protein